MATTPSGFLKTVLATLKRFTLTSGKQSWHRHFVWPDLQRSPGSLFCNHSALKMLLSTQRIKIYCSSNGHCLVTCFPVWLSPAHQNLISLHFNEPMKYKYKWMKLTKSMFTFSVFSDMTSTLYFFSFVDWSLPCVVLQGPAQKLTDYDKRLLTYY